MKTRLYNVLVPRFLRKWDDYLLHHYPVIWRTKAVFVLFYGLVAAVLLFAAGFFYPVDAQHLTVEPIRPIELAYDKYCKNSAFIVIVFIVYWSFVQQSLYFTFTKTIHLLLTLFLYSFCLFFLFSIVVPAFRIGTIVKTAYYWINSKDLETLKNSRSYPYGILLNSKDRFYDKKALNAFFNDREHQFKRIYKVEDSLFNHLYEKDTFFWKKWYLDHGLGIHYIGDYWDWNASLAKHHYLQSWTYPSFRIANNNERFSLMRVLVPQFLGRMDSVIQFEEDIFQYTRYKSKVYDKKHIYDSLVFYFRDYVMTHDTFSVAKNSISNYNFKNSYDTIKVYGKKDSVIPFLYPTLPNSIEQSVYSIRNAQLFLFSSGYVDYCNRLFHYVLFLSIILFFVSYSSFFWTSIVALISTLIIATFHTTTNYSTEAVYTTVFLSSIFGLAGLLYCYLVKKQLNDYGLYILCINLCLIFCLFGSVSITSEFGNVKTLPSNLQFYGSQIVGLTGAFLTIYVRTLPKA